jgi:hypothetical protein
MQRTLYLQRSGDGVLPLSRLAFTVSLRGVGSLKGLNLKSLNGVKAVDTPTRPVKTVFKFMLSMIKCKIVALKNRIQVQDAQQSFQI